MSIQLDKEFRDKLEKIMSARPTGKDVQEIQESVVHIDKLKEYVKRLYDELIKLEQEDTEEGERIRVSNIIKLEEMIDEEEKVYDEIQNLKRQIEKEKEIQYMGIQMEEEIKKQMEQSATPFPRSFNSYLQKRPYPSSYPKPVLNELKLIAINEFAVIPFGSYTYRFQRFPGDIDAMEQIALPISENDAATEYVLAIQRIVRNIISKRSHYYSEIKAGINPLFNFSVGQLNKGIYTPNPELFDIATNYCQQGWISDEDCKILHNVYLSIGKLRDQDSNYYDVVEYIFRKHRVLRWTAKEILAGKKFLEQGDSISLFDAIQMHTMTKVDEIALIDGRFVEITNNWHLAWKDKNGITHVFNKNEGKPDNLRNEIEKLYFSDMFYSPFKVVKRIYAYSRYMYFQTKESKWKKYIELVVSLLQGDLSSAYQIKSELDTLILVLELYKRPSPVAINNELDYAKQRIASILTFKQESTLLEINSDIDVAISTKDNVMKIELIEKVVDKLKKLINWGTITYLRKVSLNPPPRDLLPDKMSYGYLVRKPDSNPQNPYKVQKSLILASEKMERPYGKGFGGCETCGGFLINDKCLGCRDNPHIQLANIINRMY
jgi:hypothetical protein